MSFGGVLVERLYRWCGLAPIIFGLWLSACSDPATESASGHPVPQDLQTFDDGKTDGYGFNPADLMDDDLFVDATYLSAEEIQAFLEESPYGHRSFLADVSDGGTTVAEYIAETAIRFQINPLVLLVKLQVESSLIYRREEPSDRLMMHAMGCGCPDGDPECRFAPKGLFPQINCAARLFRNYLIQMENTGRSVSGWGPGIGRNTSEGERIVPASNATAALYTYTPWILPGTGGNWLFWNVTRRFSWQLLRDRPNHHWVGGPCVTNEDCPFAEGLCTTSIMDGAGAAGFCTRPCETVCPDSKQPHTQVTTCVAASEFGLEMETGFCTSRCSGVEGDRVGHCPYATICQNAARPDSERAPRFACVFGDDIADAQETDENIPEPHGG